MSYNVLPALLAALFWAASAPVINTGLNRLRQSTLDRSFLLLVCLSLCLSVGFVVCWSVSGFSNPLSGLNWQICLAGLLTFPLGTGIYYLCALAYGDRAEIASQYANVKPAISIVIGYVVFREAFSWSDVLSVTVIGMGIACVLWGAIRNGRERLTIALGMTLALAWASGESFVRSATGGASSLTVTLGALFSALAVTLAALMIYLVAGRKTPLLRQLDIRILWPFGVHGVISFGLAYPFFFDSIARLGLTRTIIITVFWPTLALVLNAVIARLRNRSHSVAPHILAASALFTVGSITHILLSQ